MQPVAVVFPDAEMWATAAFRAALSGRGESYAQDVFVGIAVPTGRRDRMVIFRRDGGPSRGLLDFPRFGVRVFARSEKEAADLARLTSGLLRSLPGDGVCVRTTELSGASSVPDVQPHRYMTFEAALRGATDAI